MKLSLNPYSLIIMEREMYYFVFSDLSDRLEIKPTTRQQECMERLKKGELIEKTELESTFTCEIIQTLITRGVLCNRNKDTTSVFSRTDAYFESFGMPEARVRLNASHVLILGCGGIGTHLAWHMATVGVGKLTLVDFDSVEESNLNRQLLFNRNDIGKYKTDVLKEKLSAINSSIKIQTMNIHITSEEDLEKVCVSDDYNLIVKSLDSPSLVSVWLDNICKKHRLAYVAGITMRDNVLIGPSFVPGISEIGWSDLLPTDQNTQRLSGIAPSVGIMLYYISSELATEAMKLLTGYGVLRYLGKIKFKNIFTNQEQIIDASSKAESQVKDIAELSQIKRKDLVLGLLLVSSVSTLSLISLWFLPVAGIITMLLPFYLYNTQKEIMSYTFIASTVFSVASSIIVIRVGHLTQYVSTSLQSIAIITLLFGAFSILILMMCGINFVISQRGIASKASNQSFKNLYKD